MTGEQAKKFIEAAEAAGLTEYQFDTDLGTHLYNGERGIIKFVEGDEMIYGIRSTSYAGTRTNANKLQVVAAWTEDLHEARIAGNYEQIKTFLTEAGATLSDSDLKIMLNIDKMNYDIIPETGDYNRFSPLTKKQYNALKPEAQAEYDAALAEENKRKHDYIGQNAAASISLG